MIFNRFRKKTFISLISMLVVVSTAVVFAISLSKKVPDPIYINSEEDFYKINDRLDGYFVINKYISFSSPIKPIGDKEHPFKGKIKGLNTVFTQMKFDYEKLDLDKYTIDGKTYVGLIPFNEGSVSGITFNTVEFANFLAVSSNDLNIGVVSGLNKGSITGCRVYNIKGTDFNSLKNINFGAYAGINEGTISKNDLVGHFNIKGSADVFSVGEFAGLCSNDSVIEMCKSGGHIMVYESDYGEINCLNAGIACGSSYGGKILNNILENASILINRSTINNCNLGGMVGFASGNSNIELNSNYYLGNISSFAINTQNISFTIGKNDSPLISVCNLLFGGSLSTKNSESIEANFNDVNLTSDKISNCFILDNYVAPTTAKIFCSKININEVTVSKMKWNNGIWNIKNGRISFKEFTLDE